MASLKRLIDVIDHLVDRRVGIVKRVDELPREPGAPDFFHYFATACNTGAFGAQANFKDTGGASVDRSLAMAKAIGEAVERYCSALYDVDELPLCSREEADFRCVEPEDCEHYHRDQFKDPLFPFVPFDDSTTIRWTPAVDPLTGETWHVPAALVYMPYYYYKDTPDAPIIQPISTGMACHCSLAEAAVSAVSAVCEVVERDAFTITWQARLAHPQIPVESLSDSNYELVRRLEWTRASVSLFNITLDAGIPTVLAVLSSPSPRTPGADFCRRRFPESRDRRPVQPGGAGTYPALHAAYYPLAAPVNPVPARSRERGGSGHAPELLVRSRQRPPGRLPLGIEEAV